MATPRTRNLRLFLSSGLSAEAKANLEILDRLGDISYVDSTDSVRIRSKTNIYLQPADQSMGGSGNADLYIGTEAVPVDNFRVYANDFRMRGTLRIYDVNPSGTQHLILRYKSGLVPESSANTTADRTLSIDLGSADRDLILNTDLSVYANNGSVEITGADGGSIVTLPPSGVLATLTREETLYNKTLVSPTITAPLGITKEDVGLDKVDNLSAAELAVLSQTLRNKVISGAENYLDDIPYGALNLEGTIRNSDIKSDAAIAYSKLSLTGHIKNSDIADDAEIAASKIKLGPIFNVAATNVQAAVAELQADIDTRALNSSFQAHVGNASGHGTISAIVGVADTQTLTNKTINADETDPGNYNLIRNLRNATIASDANIAYSKLNLALQIKNTDISYAAEDRIEGRKILPNFEYESISTYVSVKIGAIGGGGSNPLQIELAPPDGGFDASYTLKLPPSQAAAENQVLAADGNGGLKWYATAGSGTVTSVAMTVPSNLLSISGSPIETAGTLAVTLPNQSPNTVFAGPATGLSNEPSFRALVPDDLPEHTHVAADITDFQEAVDDAVDTLLQDSSSVSWTYDDEAGTMSAAVSLASFNTGNLTEGSRLYYTDTRVYQKAKTIVQGSSTVAVASSDAGETLTLSVTESSINTDNITEGTTNLFFTDERAQDAVANLIVNSNDIAKTYDDEGNSFTLNLRPEAITSKTLASPHIDDLILISDDNASGALKKVTVGSLVNLSGGAFAQDWDQTDGAQLSITHGLASKDVLIQIFDKTDGETVWISSMKRDSDNTVLLTASVAPPAGGWRVLIKRI